MKIVVIGGTGLIGSKLVDRFTRAGHIALAAAPSAGIDAFTGEGLDAAIAGAQVVIDVSNPPSFDDEVARNFYATAGHNLARAEIVAGVRHHITLSVVGTDRLLQSGYFRAKLVQEQLIQTAQTPYSLVRATQFFEFLRQIADFSTVGGTVRLPAVRFQPMAADDVAAALVDIALAPPSSAMIEIAGPEMFTLDTPVRRLLAADGDTRPVIVDASAPYAGVPVDDASLVPGPGARLGSIRLEDWIANAASPAGR
ncbi:SDR family oxidoreductase [Sphingomonas sp.]|uniref:SDR family oxidoreductase n=1 Tax=Sphingomonas sp. TaxID=28214 RepID=UPI003B3AE882